MLEIVVVYLYYNNDNNNKFLTHNKNNKIMTNSNNNLSTALNQWLTFSLEGHAPQNVEDELKVVMKGHSFEVVRKEFYSQMSEYGVGFGEQQQLEEVLSLLFY